jgi:hypothetical protein
MTERLEDLKKKQSEKMRELSELMEYEPRFSTVWKELRELSDAINKIEFPVRVSPGKIDGNWREGYALDYHTHWSQFIGHDEFGHPMFETERSEIGELLYKLKYKSDQSVVDEIVNAAASFILSWNAQFDVVVPVPPSNLARRSQPVRVIARGLSELLNLTFAEAALIKTKDTPQLKNVSDLGE